MTTEIEVKNLELARRYIQLVEDFSPAEAFKDILHPDIRLEEYPNLLMKNGSRRDYTTMTTGVQQGRKILRSNRYEIRNALAAGDWVTMEIVWTGTLAVALGTMPAGGELKAYIATVLKFKDNMIIEQHQYDCYEPLPTSEAA